MKVSQDVSRAHALAVKARENAYAPHSKFLVGAAFKVKESEELFTGCNIENASFGATVCAERTAIFSSIPKLGGNITPEFIVLVTDCTPLAVPCALCLQVLGEFASKDFPIYISDPCGIKEMITFEEFLPRPFDSTALI